MPSATLPLPLLPIYLMPSLYSLLLLSSLFPSPTINPSLCPHQKVAYCLHLSHKQKMPLMTKTPAVTKMTPAALSSMIRHSMMPLTPVTTLSLTLTSGVIPRPAPTSVSLLMGAFSVQGCVNPLEGIYREILHACPAST